MIKFLFIIILLFLACALIAVRYRKQVRAAIYAWRVLTKARQTAKIPEKQIAKTENTNDTQLVRCVKCGTWTPRKNALNLRSKAFYCSVNCLESAILV